MENIQDLSDANAQSAAEFVLTMVRTHVPNSSTKLSLDHQGYLESGLIEQTIRTYRQLSSYPYQAAVKALESGCANCQEMAYLGVLILRAAGFKGQISIGQYGLNHQFLFIEDLIVDPWAGFYCLNSMWKNNINAYGGSIKEGVMYLTSRSKIMNKIPNMNDPKHLILSFAYPSYL